MSIEDEIAAKLRACGYDLSRLSLADRTEVNRLASIAKVELPRPGQGWPSMIGVDAGLTRISQMNP